MNILKITVLAVLLHGVGHAEFMEIVGEPPAPSIKQLCKDVVRMGNTAYECISNVAPYSVSNDFDVGANNWQVMNNMDQFLRNITNHHCLLPFLKYKYNGDNIKSIELLLSENTSIPDSMLAKANTLLADIKHVKVPMQKLPCPTPTSWKKSLISLSASRLRHIGKESFRMANIESVHLPSIKSIGGSAFYECPQLKQINLSDPLKFIGSNAFGKFHLVAANIPDAAHFLSPDVYPDSTIFTLSTSDQLRFNQNIQPITVNLTCHSRVNNLEGCLNKIYNAINRNSFKNLNIKIGDSLGKAVNTDYLNSILAIEKADVAGYKKLLNEMVAHGGYGRLDMGKSNMSDSDVEAISITGNVPWVLSFPYFATVGAAFDSLFQKQKKPYGVVFNEAGLITAEAFEHCSDLAILGLGDTVAFGEHALDGLAPSTLELTVSRPENFASFISSLENAGLAFPAISKINAKFSDLIAQSASIGLYVADLLAALPPPRKFLEFRAF